MKNPLLKLALIVTILTGCNSAPTSEEAMLKNRNINKERFPKNNRRENINGEGEYIERIPPIVPGISGVTIKWHGYIYESKNGTSVRSYPGGIVKDSLGNIVFPRLIKDN